MFLRHGGESARILLTIAMLATMACGGAGGAGDDPVLHWFVIDQPVAGADPDAEPLEVRTRLHYADGDEDLSHVTVQISLEDGTEVLDETIRVFRLVGHDTGFLYLHLFFDVTQVELYSVRTYLTDLDGNRSNAETVEFEVRTPPWRELAAPIRERFSGYSVVAHDGLVYVIGGWNTDRDTVAWVDMYDPQLDRWLEAEPINLARYAPITHVVDDQIHVLHQEDFVEVYDSDAGTWSLTELVEPGVDFGSGDSTTYDGKIYVVENTSRWESPSQLYEFDPATFEWNVLRSLMRPRSRFTLATLDGKIYAIGGGVIDGFNHTPVEQYDPEGDTWVYLEETLAVPVDLDDVYEGTSVVLGDEIHVFGSAFRDRDRRRHRVRNTETGEWLDYGAPPFDIEESKAVVLDGKIYVINPDSIFVYDPANELPQSPWIRR